MKREEKRNETYWYCESLGLKLWEDDAKRWRIFDDATKARCIRYRKKFAIVGQYRSLVGRVCRPLRIIHRDAFQSNLEEKMYVRCILQTLRIIIRGRSLHRNYLLAVWAKCHDREGRRSRGNVYFHEEVGRKSCSN